MSKKLTRELIAQKVHSDKIQSIKNLNLWGNNLDDISIIEEMPNLEIVSLSVNKIRTLKPFGSLQNLRELYLRKNLIANLNEVKYLINCENLTTLWLSENPICENKNYRTIVIGVLPQLMKLDDILITDDEREKAEKKLSGSFEEEEDYEEEQERPQEKEEDFGENNRNYSNNNANDNYNEDYGQKISPKRGQNKGSAMNMKNKMEKENIEYEDEPRDYNPNTNKYNKNMRSQTRKYENDNGYDNYQPPKKEANKEFTRFKSVQYNYENLEDNENEIFARKPKIGMGRGERENDYQRKYPQAQQHSQAREERPRKSGNNNVLNSVLMLLKELNHEQLQIVKKECDRKSDY